jgi:hypothetical protein
VIDHQYGGDPRRIWRRGDGKPLLEVLEKEVGVGPARVRMIIGALRDNRLINPGKIDFKPDVWVTRLMNALHLCSTTRVNAVLQDGRRLFRDPWLADTCFYVSGAAYGVKTRAQFGKLYRTGRASCKHRAGVHRHLQRFLRLAARQRRDGPWRTYVETSLTGQEHIS